MKKIAIVSILALALAGAAFAQPFGGPATGTAGRGPGYGYARQAAPVEAPKLETVEGTLELVNAAPAIKVGTSTYYVRIPSRLFGFVDGLKEGAKVKLEGYKHEILNVKDSFGFHVEKLTLNGKVIDLSTAVAGRGQMGGKFGPGAGAPMGGQMGGKMGGRMGGRGQSGGGYGRR